MCLNCLISMYSGIINVHDHIKLNVCFLFFLFFFFFVVFFFFCCCCCCCCFVVVFVVFHDCSMKMVDGLCLANNLV